MLITILAAGTRGDTQPYLALGMELKKAGYQVRIATFENYQTFVESFGLNFYPIKGDVSLVASSDSVSNARQADNPIKIFLSFNKLQSLVFDLQQDFFNACSGSDAIVYHPGAAIGYFIAKHYKIPSILATPFPMTPTSEYPALIFYDSFRLGGRFNLITHKIFEQVMWFASRSPIKRFWKQKFGSTPDHFSCPYSKQNARALPTVVSCSNFVFPRPKDWSEHVYNTGFWFLEDDADWQPSRELMDFLQKGSPPVYVGFGSLGDPALAIETTRLVIKALKLSGQRGILATGWSGMSIIDDIPEDIFIIDSAPHSWLFPQMAAVVHHGGAGTTAAGLRAGIPSIIIPYSNDNFAWGRRVYELKAGSNAIPRKKLTADKLSQAINFILTREIKDTAKDLGMKIQSENGSATAAKIIIHCLEQQDR
jgi:sterol 3beta-glucosyltransferase